MGILNEICMTIDIINNETRQYRGSKIGRELTKRRNKKKLESIINRYILELNVTVDTVIEFMTIYQETIKQININNLYINHPDDYTTDLSYILDNGNVFTYTYDDRTTNSRNKLKILFKDNIRDPKPMISIYHVEYNFKYIGIDETYGKALNYAENVMKFIIQQYLFERMYM